MTASEQAKAAGLKSLKQVSDMVKKPRETLYNWHRYNPDLFNIVIAGCVASKPED